MKKICSYISYFYIWITYFILTAHSCILDCQSSVFCKNPAIAVFKTRENTSICWAAVEILVISPWNPASDISYQKYIYKKKNIIQYIYNKYIIYIQNVYIWILIYKV